MEIMKCYPNRYLAANDLEKETAVTIDDVSMEELDGEEKPVVWFKEYAKGMVLNKTNAGTIVGLYGGETDEWLGKRIVLRPTETEYKGEMKACIRVSLRPPKMGNGEQVGSSRESEYEEEEPPRRASRPGRR